MSDEQRCTCSSDADGCLPWPLAFLLGVWIAVVAIGDWRDDQKDQAVKVQIVTECARSEHPDRCATQMKEALG